MLDERPLHQMCHDVVVRGNLNSPYWISGSLALRNYVLASRFAISPIDLFSYVYEWEPTIEAGPTGHPESLVTLASELRLLCDTANAVDYGISNFQSVSDAKLTALAGGKAPAPYYDALRFLRLAFNETLKTPGTVVEAQKLVAFLFLAYDSVVPVSSERPTALVKKDLGMAPELRYEPSPEVCRRWLMHLSSNPHLHQAHRVDVSLKNLLRAPERYPAYVAALYA